MKHLTLIFLFCSAVVGAFAQTTVTGTIVDPNSNPYANGTVSATTVAASGQATASTSPASLNASGFFSIVLNTNIYIFNICAQPVNLGPTANPTPQQICFSSTPITISGGSQDISSAVNPLAKIIGPKFSAASSILLQHNGSNNSSQSILNLQAGSNATVVDSGSGTLTLSATPSAGAVALAPGGGTSQFIVQKAGTSAGANTFEKIRFLDSSWNWTQTDVAGSIGNLSVAGTNTLTLTPCPLGVVGTDANLYVEISGVGTAEAAKSTGAGNCTGGAASGTVIVTTVNTHGAGFTVGSASTGFYEALRDAQTLNINNIRMICQPTNPPASNFYSFFAPATVLGGSIDIDWAGCTIDVETDRAALVMPTSNSGPVHIHGARITGKAPHATMRAAVTQTACASNSATITTTLNPPVGSFVDIQQTFNQHYWGIHQVATTSASSWTYTDTNCGGSGSIAAQSITAGAGNSYEWAFVETTGEGTQVDHITLDSPGGFSNAVLDSVVVVYNDQSFHFHDYQANNGMAGCDANYCPQIIYAPGPFSTNPAVIYADHIGGSLFCTGNGLTTYNGNTVHLSDAVIQGFSEWGISTGTFRGGFGGTDLDNVYEELGGCTNPNYSGGVQAAAGTLVNGATGVGVWVRGGEAPIGQLPQFAASGNQNQTNNYYIIVKDSGGSQSAPMKCGFALVDSVSPTGTITVQCPRVATTNTTTYDLLLTTGAGSLEPYPLGSLPGGSASASGSVLLAQAQCSSLICSYSVNVATATSAYTVGQIGLAPQLNFWPGGLVLGNNSFAMVSDTSFISNVSPIINSNGPNIPSVFAQWCSSAGTVGIWINCLEGTSSGNNNPGVVGTVLQNGPSSGGQLANLKGRLNFMAPLFASLQSGHVITLVDSNPSRTLGSSIRRPTNDTNDVFIGLDQGSVTLQQGQLAFGSPIAISNYIANVGDNSSWITRVTASGLTLQKPLFQQSVTFATLPGSPSNGERVYCSDCTVTTPASCTNVTNAAACTCTNSGTGAEAKRINGAWLCN